ncbi:MAG: sigma-54-dependent Fis family transcriptional regulator [Candidatus Dadabacteria bacterium]|nr:MAG: sigma-54-dependent Fis family transcriptional regulator [Candidatus Dadabacteria bacterium]
MKTILVVDDDRSIRRSLQLHLKRRGFRVLLAGAAREGLDLAGRESPDLVLLDLRLPGEDGFWFLDRFRDLRPDTPVVVITAYDDMTTAVEAMRRGAMDHLGKPLDLGHLDAVIGKALDLAALARRGYAFAEAPPPAYDPHVIVGRSRAMKEVYKAIGAVADSPATVLIQGESGTGKELVARAIHYNGRFRTGPFVAVACSALAPGVLESELFGHERGAFTGAVQAKPGKFELAEGGTLFLDEVSEIPLDVQVKLLRFLQEREFERVGGVETRRARVRVVAATNRDLADLVARGAFRHDLYYRLRVVTIDLPPLRERPEDIPALVSFFLEKIRQELGCAVEVVPEEAMEMILAHPWPGNVRELENALRRAAVLSPGRVLLPETLRLDDARSRGRLPLFVRPLKEIEREHIENVLAYTGYEKKRTAELLGISRPTLDRKIRDYGIDLTGRRRG